MKGKDSRMQCLLKDCRPKSFQPILCDHQDIKTIFYVQVKYDYCKLLQEWFLSDVSTVWTMPVKNQLFITKQRTGSINSQAISLQKACKCCRTTARVIFEQCHTCSCFQHRLYFSSSDMVAFFRLKNLCLQDW